MEENEALEGILEEEKEPEIIIVRDVRREAICLMLGISTESDDDTILAHAKAWGESFNG